jgi:hypothetical protein
VGSKLTNPHPRLLLRLHHRVLGRVPRDINPASAAKTAPIGVESLKVDKPLSPQAKKSVLEPLKLPSPKGEQSPTSDKGALASPTHAASSHDAAGTSPRSKPAKFPEASPPSPQSYGLGATGGPQPGKGSSMAQSKKPP